MTGGYLTVASVVALRRGSLNQTKARKGSSIYCDFSNMMVLRQIILLVYTALR